MRRYATILFDLDGTLTDPAEGITRSVQYALGKMGIVVADRRALVPFIGPPLHRSFQAYCGYDEVTAFQAVAWYREYYNDIGIYENAIYPEIPALLARLRAGGRALVMATSKPTVYAERIARHFGIADEFAAIVGSHLDGTCTEKAEVVAAALATAAGCDPARAVMVGDREHDIMGARANGISALAVGYGFGTPAELRASAPDYHVATVAALAQFFEEH
jgi:phosphoglycolate phosphatase